MSGFDTPKQAYDKRNRRTGKVITPETYQDADVVTPTGSVKAALSEVNGDVLGVQNPIPTDGDSVYCKDIKLSLSDIGSFTGDLLSVVNNLDDSIVDNTTTNPKTFKLFLERPLTTSGVGIVSHTGDFSNVKISFQNRQNVDLLVIDDSTNNTKYTSRRYPGLSKDTCCIKFEFHTTDPVNVSFLRIAKDLAVVARLKAVKPDGTETEINATNGGNLKVSLEEIESGISDDGNQRLMVSPYLIDEFGSVARMLGDNLFPGAPIVIESVHHEIHCGDSYEMADVTTLPNGGVLNVLIVVPDEPGTPGVDQKWYHLKGIVESEAEALVEFFEGTVVTADGTALTSFNRNRNSALADFLPVYSGPTITSDGTLLYSKGIGSGRAVGGSAGRETEIILKNNTAYLLRVTNNITGTNRINSELDYYVQPGV